MQNKLLGLLIAVLLLSIAFSGCLEGNNNTSNIEQEAQHGSLEVKVTDRNSNLISNAQVWLWTEENFSSNPDWIEYTNTSGKILFSDLEAGAYAVSLSVMQYFDTAEEAIANAIHTTIKVHETTFVTLQIPTQSTTSEDNKTSNRPSLPGLYELALTALSNGTKIQDKLDDFIITGHEENNPGIYHIGFADLKELDIGLDSNYLYIRCWFNGTWPDNDSNWPKINGDEVHDIACNIGIDTDNNPSTGISYDGTEDFFTAGYVTNTEWHFSHSYSCGPTGILFPEEDRYNIFEYNGTYMIAGPGYDYVIGVYPLSNLNLSVGQTIALVTTIETVSYFYVHSTFDILSLDDNKRTFELGDRVQITLGENRTIS